MDNPEKQLPVNNEHVTTVNNGHVTTANNGHITTVNNDRYRISVSQMTTDMFRLS